MKTLLSIIVPVYNTEKWLRRCVDSIVYSDLNKSEIELILVNDGSTDNSREIAEEYADKLEFVKVVNQQNKGLSEARNTGIKNALGKYLWFVDSDDFVDARLKDMLNDIVKADADCFLTYMSYYKQGLVTRGPDIYHTLPKGIVMSGRDAVLNGIAPSSACVVFFRHEFLIENGLLFNPEYIHEDVVLTYTCFCKAKKIYVSDYAKYICEKRDDSISNPQNAEKRLRFLLDDLKVSEYFKRLAEQYSDDKPVYRRILCISSSVKNGLLSAIVLGKTHQNFPDSVLKEQCDRLWREGYFPMRGPFTSWRQCLYVNYANCMWMIKKLTGR